ncbi:transcriptional regulator of RNA polII, SAGA, subunit [Thalictrum thalictroides]|uniref:Transcriptional regulator of RNA polII, SAGA, subunit n=1 Tax=Thalictrum thalictroides TaxID=46969 RepID=A0A7J6W806_THATH|nr:transcriptional regulator of RNA polII, SAGA, subunit [Thalictrum thalictroides]
MPPCRHSSRTDTVDIKAEIVGKVGQEKAEKYFYYLNKLISLKLSKSEFNKLCINTIGRENVSLHNRFIESIVKNASAAKTPPSNGSKSEGSLNVRVANGYHKNNLHLLYGDAFPLSPRKGRSSNLRDRRFKDRPSPLGPNGKVPSIIHDESLSKTQEKKNVTELVSPNSRPRLEFVSVEDGEEVEQATGSPSLQTQSRISVSAPLGIQRARKTLRSTLLSSVHVESMCNSYELPDTMSLRKQIERKLESEGLGISMDCANLLNNGLDVFLKRLIKPCLDLARSRGGVPVQNGLGAQKCLQRSRCISASMLDFRVAMELQPPLLGENWPVQLEKVCSRASEE